MKDYGRMYEACLGCKHFRSKRFVHKRLRLGWCAQADDGYMFDCLLDAGASEEAQADERNTVVTARASN